MSLRRKSPLRRSRMRRGTKPIRKVNPERQAKRRQSYAAKLRAYKKSATYREVEQRADGQCEKRIPLGGTRHTPASEIRCAATRQSGHVLTHHHKTYARCGGDELPEDIELLCETHNWEAEAAHPTRNRNYARSTRRPAA